ncbi:Trk system potassium uptake protein TrkA-like protein 1 [Chlamydiales bacterium STE3]|nr:Trk system potassium uptake protein TrkA-like protein 1 [Chlamydiales bacterium STE3]
MTMLNIVIIGAGTLGRYIATLLSKDNHNIIVVDKDKRKLEEISWNTDVATRHGDGTDWQLFDDLLEAFPNFLLALTNDDAVNLVACSIAKQLGYPGTFARIHDNRFLNKTRLDFSHVFHVDHFIAPELLVANEMIKSVVGKGAYAFDFFAHGAVQLCTFRMPAQWNTHRRALKDLQLPEGVMIGIIYRESKNGDQIIFPHGEDVILPGDEVTFIGETEAMEGVPLFLDNPAKSVSSVVVIGGSFTAVQLTKLLEKRNVSVRIIEKSYERCQSLAEQVPHATILNGDGLDLEFLKSQRVSQSDLVVACTSQDELNLMICMVAKEIHCKDVLMVLSNPSYLPILDKLEVRHVISPYIVAANRILSNVYAETINSLVSLYENRAEVIEVKVSMDSQVIGIPISDLGPLLPKDFLIAMIQNRGRLMVANGNRIISPGDTVIVVMSPKHMADLGDIF